MTYFSSSLKLTTMYTIDLRDSFKKLKRFSVTESESEYYSTMVRAFSGRMTKKRYKALSRWCRLNSFRRNCGCEHDCCGHLIMQEFSFIYSRNQVVVTVNLFYNY